MSEPTPDSSTANAAFDLRETYVRQGPKLLRLLRRWSGAVDAEDDLQQAFVHLIALDPERAGEIASPEPYLRRTALNIVYDRARTSDRRAYDRHISVDDVDLASHDTVAGLEARDMLRRLEAIVKRMPARRREIFLANRIDGYSYGEIAARTGLTIKGVEKQMSRAIAQVDRLMARR